MSHTLHRLAGGDGLKDDYVILVMAAKGINNGPDGGEKYKEYLRIFSRHNPVNLGGMGIGHLYDTPFEKILENVDEKYPFLPMVHGVFSNRDDLVAALKEVKTEDLGFSVIVTGLVDSTKCLCKEAGLKRHSINYSLGVWGDMSLMPDETVLKIASMCGHAMISFNSVQKEIDAVKAGKTTPRKAAERLAKPCACGIFNPDRAERILEELL